MKKARLLPLLLVPFLIGSCGSSEPTKAPTSEVPTETPSKVPTEVPTEKPTEVPTEVPTETPTETPTKTPTETPSEDPVELPSSISIIGSFGGHSWDQDVDLITTDEGHTWELSSIYLNEKDEWKLRKNYAWNGETNGADWGYQSVKTSSGIIENNKNIQMTESGHYNIKFNFDLEEIYILKIGSLEKVENPFAETGRKLSDTEQKQLLEEISLDVKSDGFEYPESFKKNSKTITYALIGKNEDGSNHYLSEAIKFDTIYDLYSTKGSLASSYEVRDESTGKIYQSNDRSEVLYYEDTLNAFVNAAIMGNGNNVAKGYKTIALKNNIVNFKSAIRTLGSDLNTVCGLNIDSSISNSIKEVNKYLNITQDQPLLEDTFEAYLSEFADGIYIRIRRQFSLEQSYETYIVFENLLPVYISSEIITSEHKYINIETFDYNKENITFEKPDLSKEYVEQPEFYSGFKDITQEEASTTLEKYKKDIEAEQDYGANKVLSNMTSFVDATGKETNYVEEEFRYIEKPDKNRLQFKAAQHSLNEKTNEFELTGLMIDKIGLIDDPSIVLHTTLNNYDFSEQDIPVEGDPLTFYQNYTDAFLEKKSMSNFKDQQKPTKLNMINSYINLVASGDLKASYSQFEHALLLTRIEETTQLRILITSFDFIDIIMTSTYMKPDGSYIEATSFVDFKDTYIRLISD